MDFFLLAFESYADYLASFVRKEDKYYIRNEKVSNDMAECGHCAVNVYSKQQYLQKRGEAHQFILNRSAIARIYSNTVNVTDPVIKQLAKREKLNTERAMSTIIFLTFCNTLGHEISAYIDFEHSLRKVEDGSKDALDWRNIFAGKKKLRPQKTDLSYINWSSTEVKVNETANYKAIHNDRKGLKFMFKDDHKMIYPDPFFQGGRHEELKRTMCYSKKYGQVILYDYHILKFAK